MYTATMDYIQHIERALAHIEANIKCELTLAGLAKVAGYSEYHFLRVFKHVTGHTPVDYIRKRRLSEVAREIGSGDGSRPISDIAFEYGFNSKENFTRAFKAEHGVLPTEYRAAGNSLKLFDRLQLMATPFVVTPRIVTISGFALTVFPNAESSIPKFWNWYNCKKLSLRLAGGSTLPDYGVCNWNSGENRLDYFIGVQTVHACGDVAGTQQLNIPGGMYAVFATPPASHFNFINTVHQTWKYISEDWLVNGEYRRCKTRPYEFETYVEASRTFSEEIYIPIENI